MRRLKFCFLIVTLITLSAPSRAENATASSGAPSMPPSVFIFAYPGTTCPGGSELYKGPEQKLAAASGAVYCRFARKVYTISKKNSAACPVGMKPYTDANATPAADVLWCEKDANFKLPPPPAQPPK